MIADDRFLVLIGKTRFEQRPLGPYYVRAGEFYQIRNLDRVFPRGALRRELESEKN
jgi:hypothetical protein